MYVCLCKGVTDSQIRAAAATGKRSLGQLRRELGVASQCGKCGCHARDILRNCEPQPMLETAQPLFHAVA